jgi:hypothetical protein
MVESGLVLAEMEESVLAEVHGMDNELLSALAGIWSEGYPAATVRCACGEEAQWTVQKILLGMIHLRRAYCLCGRCDGGRTRYSLVEC